MNERKSQSVRRKSAIAVILLCSAVVVACQTPKDVGDGRNDWPAYGRDAGEQRFSPLAKLTTANVANLGLAWSYDFRVGRGVEGTPLMVDGVLYVTSAWSIVYAVDARTGKELWVFDPEADRIQGAKSCCDVVSRGLAYDKGKIFVASIDGRLIALDAKTGAKLWDVATIDKETPLVITGAPRVANGLVVIGNSGADITLGPKNGSRGYVSAYDADTGKLAWRFYTVPGDPSKGPEGAASDSVMPMAAKTWTGRWWENGGGGTVWDSITYDPELDRVYIGVGNGSPWNRQVRSPGGGDNLFLASIVALDRKTGHYIWHYQTSPGETWDHTATQSIILATAMIDGQSRRILMQAPKNGFFYVIDRDTGKLISAKNIVPMAKAADTPPGAPISWAYGVDLQTGRPLENPEARFENGATAFVHPVGNGAHPWAPMAYDPHKGIAYFYVQDPASMFKSDPDYVPRRFIRASGFAAARGSVPAAAHAATGVSRALKPDNGALLAWDVMGQREVWRSPYDWAGNGGALATAGELVFQATGDPLLVAYDARTGSKLWSYDIQASAQGGPISYELDGEQYIAVAAGNGGSGYLLAPPSIPDKPAADVGRLLVFKLGGTAKLPPLPNALPPFPVPPEFSASAESITHGQQLYGAYCTGCHGINAVSRRVLPDLRKSAVMADANVFRSVVFEGLLEGNGMPKFGPYLSVQDVTDIRAFLADQGKKGYEQQQAQSEGAAKTTMSH